MHMIQRRFYIACGQCQREFGGPSGGDYDPEEYHGGYEGITEMLVDEALDLNWIRIIWRNLDVLVCSPGCAADWMNETLENWQN